MQSFGGIESLLSDHLEENAVLFLKPAAVSRSSNCFCFYPAADSGRVTALSTIRRRFKGKVTVLMTIRRRFMNKATAFASIRRRFRVE